MQNSLTTNAVRRELVRLGAKAPSRRAVSMVAIETCSSNGITYWEPCFPEEVVAKAVQSAKDLRGEEAYRAFARSLKT